MTAEEQWQRYICCMNFTIGSTWQNQNVPFALVHDFQASSDLKGPQGTSSDLK